MPLGGLTALILCGGAGTRLRPLIGNLPKSLAPVGGRPFVHHLFEYLRQQGISDVILCTQYGAEQIQEYCKEGSGWGLRIRYSKEEKPLGTAGAVKKAERLIKSSSFMVFNGDSLIQADLSNLLRFHEERGAQISLVLAEVSDKTRYGAVHLNNHGEILGFEEKEGKGRGWVNAGIYLLNRNVLDPMPENRPISMEKDILPRFSGKGLYGLIVDGSLIDIGTPEDYQKAQILLEKVHDH